MRRRNGIFSLFFLGGGGSPCRGLGAQEIREAVTKSWLAKKSEIQKHGFMFLSSKIFLLEWIESE